MSDPIVYHIPVCPFSQRLEILLDLKGKRNALDFHVIDITRPRPDWFLEKTGGSTASPVLETSEGNIIKESLVILRYLEQVFPEPPVAQSDPYRRAVENLLTRKAGDFANQGYGFVMNQDPDRRDELRERMLQKYADLNDFLTRYSPTAPYLFEEFGWAEAVFTPFFQRFWFLEYYEDFQLPDEERFARIREWKQACISHPAAQQVTREQIVKLYYDYAQGAGNGSLLPGREKSSLGFEPDWRERPMPPKDKYERNATDEELGLV